MVYKGGMVEVVETLETKLKRHEDALVACMAEITRLREENARLRSSENTAHSVLREVYNDPTASPAVRQGGRVGSAARNAALPAALYVVLAGIAWAAPRRLLVDLNPRVRADVFASAHPARVTIPSHTLRAVRRVPPCVRQRSLAS